MELESVRGRLGAACGNRGDARADKERVKAARDSFAGAARKVIQIAGRKLIHPAG
jgi:hypothetical protein